MISGGGIGFGLSEIGECHGRILWAQRGISHLDHTNGHDATSIRIPWCQRGRFSLFTLWGNCHGFALVGLQRYQLLGIGFSMAVAALSPSAIA